MGIWKSSTVGGSLPSVCVAGVIVLVSLGLSVLSAADDAEMQWLLEPGAGQARVSGGQLLLELGAEGTIELKSAPIPVKPNARMHLAFSFMSEKLTEAIRKGALDRRRGKSRMVVGLRWFDEKGADVDIARAGLGFSPVAKQWVFRSNNARLRRVADKFSVPAEARSVEISFMLERIAADEGDRGATSKATIGNVALGPGDIDPVGLDFNSGPADAGSLSPPPSGHRFAANLVPNGALEAGENVPEGWKIEGDNAGGAAVWQEGGALSGRCCLKIVDQGPYVRSWGERNPSVYVPGGRPRSSSTFAREEVSARWVSQSAPAQPGAVYQATAFLWCLNRQGFSAAEVHPVDVNPVRIQFLDATGKVLPYDTEADRLPGDRHLTKDGWVRVLGRPVAAPANAASVRVAVALHHAFHYIRGGTATKWSSDRGFVLVDNIALYRVQSKRSDPEEAFWDTAKAGGLPFVPTSAAHRPDTLSVESDTGNAGGILFAPANPRSKPVNLRLQNWIGDQRDVEIRCEVEDWLGRSLFERTVPATLPPFGTGTASIPYSDDIPLGAYTIRYVIREAGVDQDRDVTRFGVLAERETTPGERGRYDYPFSIWTPHFSRGEALLGQMLEAAGAGKDWYAGKINIQPLIKIEDPAARRRAVQENIAGVRRNIAVRRRYGITPMGYLSLRPDESFENARSRLEPILADVVKQLVAGLKNDLHCWRWGNEFLGGRQTELDRASKPGGIHGDYYLLWDHPGTVRQYWQTYRVAYHAAKAADPDCRFGPAAASDHEGTVLRLFFQVCKPDELDSFGMNCYWGMAQMWKNNLAELKKAGIPNLPLYSSEFRPEPPSDLRVRLRDEHLEVQLVRDMVTGWAAGLHQFPNLSHGAQVWLFLNVGNERNMLDSNNRVLPRFLAFAAMTNILGAGRFVERIDLPGAVIFVRERSVRPGLVGVMWSTGPQAVVKLDVGSESMEVADVMGNRRRLATPGGTATIPLTPMPQYLLGATVVRSAR